MQNLTQDGLNLIDDISRRYGLSRESALNMLISVNNGGGTMAQFFCPELGGGQWMRGGMTMVSDMFNHRLKMTVDNLCGELSQALASRQLFKPAPAGGAGGSNQWWGENFGNPSSSGGQNNIRYAFFPQSRRLAVQRDGQVTVFDTLDHNISGVSQQQGGDSSLTFSSQYGTLTTLSLPLISGPGLALAAPTNFAAPPTQNNWTAPRPSPVAPAPAFDQNSASLVQLLEKLGQLRDAGVLTQEEFNAKKADLLSRL
ncbi:MAG: hypothetical protein RIQ79_1603 [Verrucomicrobiota bacterium]